MSPSSRFPHSDRTNPRDWLWPLLLAGVIFYASGQSHIAGPNVVGIDKVAHFFVYGLLATLLVRIPSMRSGHRFLLWPSILIASLYGLTDEIHQTFTPGREVDTVDWLVDTAGAALAVAIYARWTPYRRCLEWGFAGRVEAARVPASESSL